MFCFFSTNAVVQSEFQSEGWSLVYDMVPFIYILYI